MPVIPYKYGGVPSGSETAVETDGSADPGLVRLRRLRAELRESMAALEQALAAPIPGRAEAWIERVHVALVELSADNREHVAITEGADGLHNDIVAASPRLTYAVSQLSRDHTAIGTQLEDVLSRASGSGEITDAEAIRGLGTALLGRLVRHRQAGADLIYEAFQCDIGGET